MSDTKDVGFYNAQDGLKGRDGGPYLDHINRQTAEVQRAIVENRKPADLNGPLPADVGTVLVTAPFVIDNSTTSNPSMALRPGFGTILSDKTLSDAKQGSPVGDINEVTVADPISVLPVDTRTEVPAEETAPPAEPAVTSTSTSTTSSTPAPSEPLVTPNP